MSFEEENLLLDLDSENEEALGPSTAFKLSGITTQLHFEAEPSNDKMHQNSDFTKRLRESNHSIKRREPQSTVCSSFLPFNRPGSPSIYTEHKTKLRIKDKCFHSNDFERIMHHKIIPLSKLKSSMTDGDIMGNFVVIGVIFHKTGVKTSENGSKYVRFKLTDLQTKINLFLFNNALGECPPIATVIALLNPVRFYF